MNAQTLEQPVNTEDEFHIVSNYKNIQQNAKKETESNPRMKQPEHINKYEKMNSSTSRQAQQKKYP